MKRSAAFVTVALLLAGCGVYGPKGNDTGGIIPWSPDNERAARSIAQDNCGRFNKFARITSIRRVYGDYIAYECRFELPRRSR